MTKTFLVAGSNWIAEVSLSDIDHLPPESLQIEAATRAVESLYGKRKDITIQRHKPIKLTKKQKKDNALQASLIELLTTELQPGCGIGMLLCIWETQNSDEKDQEYYINSKSVLENVGIPKLIDVFEKKYPKQKTH